MERRAEFDNNVTLGLPPGPAVPPVPPLLLRPELKTGVHTKCPQQHCAPWPRRGKDKLWHSHTEKLL